MLKLKQILITVLVGTPSALLQLWTLLVCMLLLSRRAQCFSEPAGDEKYGAGLRISRALCGCRHIEVFGTNQRQGRRVIRFHFGRCLDRA